MESKGRFWGRLFREADSRPPTDAEQRQLDEASIIERWIEAGAEPPPRVEFEALWEWAAKGFPAINFNDAPILPAPPPEPVAPDPKLAVSRAEAADLFGISVDAFKDHVWPHIRVLKIGRREVIPVDELRRFMRENAAYGLSSDG